MLRSIGTFAVAGVSGWLVARTGIPLGWMIGSMLSILAMSLLRMQPASPAPIMPYVQASVGTLLGAAITAEFLGGLGQWWGSLLCLLATLTLAGGINFYILRRGFSFGRGTSILCAMPGGLTEMILLSEHSGANQSRVAIIHALRIALSILIIPILIGWVAHIDLKSGTTSDTPSMALSDWGWLLICVGSGIAAKRWTPLPTPLILVPMLVSGVVHVTGVSQFSVPTLITGVVQLLIGVNIGSRFSGISLRQLLAVLTAAVSVVAVQITVGFSAATLMAKITTLDPLALMLAYAPGGLAEMSLVAVAMGREVAFVGFHHICRVLMALFIAPALVHRFAGNPKETP